MKARRDLPAMHRANLAYVTEIRTTPTRLWVALTDPDETARYWGHRNVSSWAEGDSWEHRRVDDGVADAVGTILEVDPPRHLAHTWVLAAAAHDPERLSRITIDLELFDDHVR